MFQRRIQNPNPKLQLATPWKLPKNKGKRQRLSVRLFINVFIFLNCSFLTLYIYFGYFHKVYSAYDLQLRPATPEQFISADYDFLHGLSGSGHYSDDKQLMKNRKRRKRHFPSVEERVRLYMSNWYQKPCNVVNEFGLNVDERLSYSYDGPKHHQAVVKEENARDKKNDEVQPKNGTTFDFYEVTFDSRLEDEMLYGILDTRVSFNEPFVLQMSAVQACIDNSKFKKNTKMRKRLFYCEEALDILNMLPKIEIEVEKTTAMGATTITKFKASRVTDWDGRNHPIPIIIQFLADSSNSASLKHQELNSNPIPYFNEYRPSTTSKNAKNRLRMFIREKDLDCTLPGLRKCLQTMESSEGLQTTNKYTASYAPIIWFLNSKHHLKTIHNVIAVDIPWNWKKDEAIIIDVHGNKNTGALNDNSMIDSKFPIRKEKLENFDKTNRIEKVLEYKIIVIPLLERVESLNELKWALYSRSVVLMPRPKLTSVFMEELLEPYVHFVPLEENCSLLDVQKQISWIAKHKKKARHVAERGTLFVHDLFFHEDSKDDNIQIQMKILERYSKFFVDGNAH